MEHTFLDIAMLMVGLVWPYPFHSAVVFITCAHHIVGLEAGRMQ